MTGPLPECCHHLWSFINYVDKILAFFDHLPTSGWHFWRSFIFHVLLSTYCSNFLCYIPTSFCQHSVWMTPYINYNKFWNILDIILMRLGTILLLHKHTYSAANFCFMIWNRGNLSQHNSCLKSCHGLGLLSPKRYESDLLNEVL